MQGFRGAVLIIDEHHGAPCPVDDGGGDRRSVPGAAVHPDQRVRQFVKAVGEFVQGDVDRAGDAAGVVLLALPHVEDDEILATALVFGDIGETGGPVAAQC